MADKGGLQLLPETRKKIEVRIPGENRLITIGAVLAVLVFISAGAAKLYQNNLEGKIEKLDSQILEIEASRDKEAEQSLLTLRKQATVAFQSLNDHVYWSRGFEIIENSLQSNVQFKNMSLNFSDSTITLKAESDNYTTIARQLASFNVEESIEDVDLEDVRVLTSGRLEMNMRVKFNTDKFLKI